MDALSVLLVLTSATLCIELANSALLLTLLARFRAAMVRIGAVIQRVMPALFGRAEAPTTANGPTPAVAPPGSVPVPPAAPVVDPTWKAVKTSEFMAQKGYQTYRTADGKLRNVRLSAGVGGSAPPGAGGKWAALEALAEKYHLEPEDVLREVGSKYGVDLSAMAATNGEAALEPPSERGPTPRPDPIEAMIPRLLSGEPLSASEKAGALTAFYRKMREPSTGSGESVGSGDWWT